MTSPSWLAQSDLASVSTDRDVNDINLLPVQSVGVSVGSRAAVADHDVPQQACDDEHDESSTETASLHRDHSAVYASAAELEEFRTILSHREAKVRHSPTMLHRPTTHCMLHSAAWAGGKALQSVSLSRTRAESEFSLHLTNRSQPFKRPIVSVCHSGATQSTALTHTDGLAPAESRRGGARAEATCIGGTQSPAVHEV
jgi:hypothetical protein